MEVKGTAVKSIPEFVKTKFPTRFDEWLLALPDESRKIMKGDITINNWYPLNEGLSIPVRTVGQLFYGDAIKGAQTMGRYSADIALSGIFKIYVQLGSPKQILERANRVFSSYFRPSEIETHESRKNYFCFHIIQFDQMDEVVEQNMAGWIQRALEISGCKNVRVDIPKSLVKKCSYSEFVLTWE